MSYNRSLQSLVARVNYQRRFRRRNKLENYPHRNHLNSFDDMYLDGTQIRSGPVFCEWAHNGELLTGRYLSEL